LEYGSEAFDVLFFTVGGGSHHEALKAEVERIAINVNYPTTVLKLTLWVW
jgi:hypothetical protein